MTNNINFYLTYLTKKAYVLKKDMNDNLKVNYNIIQVIFKILFMYVRNGFTINAKTGYLQEQWHFRKKNNLQHITITFNYYY